MFEKLFENLSNKKDFFIVEDFVNTEMLENFIDLHHSGNSFYNSDNSEIFKDNKNLLSLVIAERFKRSRSKSRKLFNDVCPRIMNGNLDVVAICIFINVWEDDIWEDDTSKSSRFCDFCKMVVKKIDDKNNRSIYEELIILETLIKFYERLKSTNNDFVKDICEAIGKVLEKIKDFNIDYYTNTYLFSPLCFAKTRLKGIKASDFGKRKVFPIINSYNKLVSKEIENSDIEYIKKHVKINEKEIAYLNFFFCSYSKNKISFVGKARIATLYLMERLSKNELLTEDEKENITEAINHICINTHNHYLEQVFQVCIIPNTENLKFWNSLLGHRDWVINDIHEYIINDKEKLQIFSPRNKTRILFYFLETEKEKKKFIKLLTLLTENNFEKEIFFQNAQIFEKAVDFNVFNIKDYNFINSDSFYLRRCLDYMKNKSFNDLIQYALSFINSVGVSKINMEFLSYIEGLDFSYVEDELLKEFFPILDELIFSLKPQCYMQHIVENLLSEKYIEIMEISEEEKKKILKTILEKKLLNHRHKEIVKQIVMTEEEIEKEEEEKLISSIKKAETSIELYYCFSKSKYKHNKNVCQHVVDKILDLNKEKISYRGLDIIKELFRMDYFTPSTLFDFFTELTQKNVKETNNG